MPIGRAVTRAQLILVSSASSVRSPSLQIIRTQIAMTTITIPASLPPRPRRKTAKAAAETISKALDPTEEDADSGEEYKPSPPPTVSSQPKRRPLKRHSSTSSSTNAGKKCALSPETTEYLKNWMLSPDHIDHPYPTEEEKADIMRHCGIEMKQLTNWFVNNRKRIWKPKLEELKRRQSSGGAVLSETERAVKKRKTANAHKSNLPVPKVKTGVHTAKSHENVKAANKNRTCIVGSTIGKQLSPTAIVSSSPSIEDDSDLSITLPNLPPLPSLLEGVAATVTPLVDPMILSNVTDVIDDAPLLPMTLASQTLEGMAPHSCNLVDPVTNQMVSLYVSC